MDKVLQLLLLVIGLSLIASNRCLAQTSILLADDNAVPNVTVTWPTRDGKVTELTGPRRFLSSAQKSPLGPNIDCYAALGGTRLNKGLAHGSGAVVLVGLYKQDASKPFFQDIAEGAAITIKLTGVVMNHPAEPRLKTGLMHLRYMLEDLNACGIGGSGRNLFNTVDPEDPVIAKAAGGSVRPGCLDGSRPKNGPEHGSVEAKLEPNGSISITFTVPYWLLRHTQDPYQRTNPGGFFEPNHFHIEMELMPVKADEGDKKPAEPSKQNEQKSEKPKP